jgi:NAD(P)-dependent dehydrogenase (short-subunit alcohol dehydrogenase family)
MRLAGKTALITGAARGIGLAFAQAYVREGARVALADIDIARARASAAEIGTEAVAVEMDITRQDSIDAGVAETVAALGSGAANQVSYILFLIGFGLGTAGQAISAALKL